MIGKSVFSILLATCSLLSLWAQSPKAENPVIFSDVPDLSMIRIGNTYYMSSTTMHMAPGVPIMKSTDLINWKLINYAYDTLADVDAMNLNNGKHAYGRGSWASCIRYHDGLFYVSTFASTTNKTYIYTTPDIEKGPWKKHDFSPSLHDHTLFFDDDGKVYMIYGTGKLTIVELNTDLSGIKPGGINQVAIENASAPAGNNIGLQAEGSQLLKKDGKYYLVNITWPKGGMRTVVVHRADKITGPWEGKLVLQDKGVAQGSFIDMPDGRWFAYLFQDYGAVGRIPFLAPVEWKDGWPVIGIDGKVPMTLDLPASKGLIPNIVASDEFNRKKKDKALPLVWQWNHNPDNSLWSITERKGYLRLKTGRIDTTFMQARNTLTQRTFGPHSTGITKVDVTNLKEGDYAGLTAFQRKYGQVGVTVEGGNKYIFMASPSLAKTQATDTTVIHEKIPLQQNTIYFKIDCNFRDKTDIATFYYSLNGKTWTAIGKPLKMEYTLMEHFMGYRFGLFNYATKQTGGYADFDYCRISAK